MKHLLGLSLTAGLLVMPLHAQPRDTVPLPTPLTLEFAIASGTLPENPSLMAARAGERAAEAELEEAESNYALESSVSLVAGYVEPNELALDQTHDDHSALLDVRKTLYDFGLTGDRVGSAENLIMASRMETEYTRQTQVIEITEHYFDVLLADLKYTWDNEAMAMEYVDYDRIRERHALEQVSDVELLQSENAYQVALTRRSASEIMQRTNRALLAVAINRPGELSANLVKPVLDTKSRELPDLDVLVAAAVRGNLELQALRNRETAARLALDAARKRIRPTLDASLQVGRFTRKTPGRDDMRARLNLIIPLNESGGQRSEIAERKAEWLELTAQVMRRESDLRNRIAEVWQQIQQLRVRTQELKVASSRAEIELDRARGEYALEMKTDLGDAMVNTSRVRFEQAKNDYELALAWMNLYLLIGREPGEIIAAGSSG